MVADRPRSRRRIKPEYLIESLARRDDTDQDFAEAVPSIGPPLLLDTSVYLDVLKGNLPPEVVEVQLRTPTLTHLTVVLGDLSHNFGRE